MPSALPPGPPASDPTVVPAPVVTAPAATAPVASPSKLATLPAAVDTRPAAPVLVARPEPAETEKRSLFAKAAVLGRGGRRRRCRRRGRAGRGAGRAQGSLSLVGDRQMMRIESRQVLFAVAAAASLGLAGCGGTRACRSGTLFVTVDFVANATSAEKVSIDVKPEGAPLRTEIFDHAPGAAEGTIEVDFPGGYQDGHPRAAGSHRPQERRAVHGGHQQRGAVVGLQLGQRPARWHALRRRQRRRGRRRRQRCGWQEMARAAALAPAWAGAAVGARAARLEATVAA